MSNYQTKLIQILGNSDKNLHIRFKIKNVISTKINSLNKISPSQNIPNKLKLYNNKSYEKNNDSLIFASIPIIKNYKYKKYIIKKDKLELNNKNNTFIDTNLDKSLISKNTKFLILNKNKKKERKGIITNYENTNITKLFKKRGNSKKNTLTYNNKNISTDNFNLFKNKKFIKDLLNKDFIFNKSTSLINECHFKKSKPIINKSINNKITKNSKSSNKIQEKIRKMKEDFSSKGIKKILINRPMRTLNSFK